MPPLDQGRSSWRLACQKVRGPVKFYCPAYINITTGAGSFRTLVLNPNVDGVARLWASKLVLHRQAHASQRIAHLLLDRRRVSRCRKKCCFTNRPKSGFECIDAGRQPHTKALLYVAGDEKLMHLTDIQPIQTS